jgi:hypothetical protein
MSFYSRPIPAPKKKKSKGPSPSSLLTDAVIKFIKLNGGAARRVNTVGVWDAEQGIFRKGGMKRGFEDVDASFPIKINGIKFGLKVAIEIKIGRDTQSDHQLERQEELEKTGAIYLVAKDIDSFIQEFKKIINETIIKTRAGNVPNPQI